MVRAGYGAAVLDVRQATTDDIAPLARSLARAFLDDPTVTFMTGGKELPLEKGEQFCGHMARSSSRTTMCTSSRRRIRTCPTTGTSVSRRGK